MKVLKCMMFFMAVATMPLLTSCDKEDDETTTVVEGTYTGKISVMGTETPNSVAVVTKTNDTYSLLLKDLNLNMMGAIIPIGDVTFTDLTASNGNLSGGSKQTTIVVTLPDELVAQFQLPANQMPVDVSLVSGNVTGNKLTFKLSVDVPVMPGVPLSVDFEGTR